MRSPISYRIRSKAWQVMLVLLVGGLVYLGVIFVAGRAESHLLMSVGGFLAFSAVSNALFVVFAQSRPLWRNVLSGLLCASVMLVVAEIFWTIPLLSVGEVQRWEAARGRSVDDEPTADPIQ